jgi:hypothetical protein
MFVTLNSSELLQAATIGIMRRVSAIARQRKEPFGTPNAELWGNDIESCCAELVVAKVTGSYWHAFTAAPHTLEGDVGRRQVRSTQRVNGGLIVHDDDKDDAAFILVVGVAPSYNVMGWMLGRDAKVARWWNETRLPRPAFLVPAGELHDIASLQL